MESMQQTSLPIKYEGLWRREVINRSNGISDRTTNVWWFQGSEYCIDVRVPVGALSSQKTAFAGITVIGDMTEYGDRLEWRPEIAFPTLSEEVDAGYMRFDSDDLLYEKGVDGSYEEYWYRVPNGVMTSSRTVAQDGLVTYVIEGDYWKAVAEGRPTDKSVQNGDSVQWMNAAVYEKSEQDGNWNLRASTVS